MKIDGEYVFDADVSEVWDALFDPQVLAAVMPGCEKLDMVNGSYVGDINVKVGPIQGKFTGKVDLSDQVPPKSYKMVVDGRGAQGFVKATATIALEPEGEGKTRIKYGSDAQVGGKIASVGQRLVETSARAIVKQSLEGLAENVKIRAAAHRKLAATAPAPTPSPSPVPIVAEAVAESPNLAAVPTPPPPAPLPAPPPPPAAPVIEYKKADASKIASAVAKDVSKKVAPILIAIAAAVAVVIYLLVR